jgi:hypothetical protein
MSEEDAFARIRIEKLLETAGWRPLQRGVHLAQLGWQAA